MNNEFYILLLALKRKNIKIYFDMKVFIYSNVATVHQAIRTQNYKIINYYKNKITQNDLPILISTANAEFIKYTLNEFTESIDISNIKLSMAYGYEIFRIVFDKTPSNNNEIYIEAAKSLNAEILLFLLDFDNLMFDGQFFKNILDTYADHKIIKFILDNIPYRINKIGCLLSYDENIDCLLEILPRDMANINKHFEYIIPKKNIKLIERLIPYIKEIDDKILDIAIKTKDKNIAILIASNISEIDKYTIDMVKHHNNLDVLKIIMEKYNRKIPYSQILTSNTHIFNCLMNYYDFNEFNRNIFIEIIRTKNKDLIIKGIDNYGELDCELCLRLLAIQDLFITEYIFPTLIEQPANKDIFIELCKLKNKDLIIKYLDNYDKIGSELYLELLKIQDLFITEYIFPALIKQPANKDIFIELCKLKNKDLIIKYLDYYSEPFNMQMEFYITIIDDNEFIQKIYNIRGPEFLTPYVLEKIKKNKWKIIL